MLRPIQGRNLLFGCIILMLFFGSACAVVFIEHVRPEKDNVALYVVIFGFVTTNVAFLVGKWAIDSGLDAQNVVLGSITDKVNGGTERALNQIREQTRIALHDKDNELNAMKLKIAELTMDRDNAIRAQAAAEGRMKECENKVVDVLTKLAKYEIPPNVQGTHS